MVGKRAPRSFIRLAHLRAAADTSQDLVLNDFVAAVNEGDARAMTHSLGLSFPGQKAAIPS